jgi:hypothetical protein
LRLEWAPDAGDVRKIPGRPRYALSRDGVLYDLKKQEEAYVYIGKNGYRVARLYRGKRLNRTPIPIYKLMALTYHGPKPFDGALVRHLDGDCHNDAADNLQWGTPKENREDLRKHSEDRAKLTPELKQTIIHAIKTRGNYDFERVEIAKEYNVSFLTVNRLFWLVKDGKA